MSEFLMHLQSLSAVAWLNAVWSAVIFGVCLGAICRMSEDTPPSIAQAFVTIGAAAAGWFFTTFWPLSWGEAFDTLFLGGVASLIIATRKHPIWVQPGRIPAISQVVNGLSWATFLVTI